MGDILHQSVASEIMQAFGMLMLLASKQGEGIGVVVNGLGVEGVRALGCRVSGLRM